MGVLGFIAKAYRDDLTIEGGVLRAECARLDYGPDDHPHIEAQGNL